MLAQRILFTLLYDLQAINWASLRNKYKNNSLRVLKNTIGRYLIGHAIVSSYKLVNFKGSFKPLGN